MIPFQHMWEVKVFEDASSGPFSFMWAGYGKHTSYHRAQFTYPIPVSL